MVIITKEKWEENDIEAIVDKSAELWLKEKHLEKKETFKFTSSYKQI